MHVISVIEEPDVMKKILKHLGLWDVKRQPRPVANALPIDVFHAYDHSRDPVRMITSGTLIVRPCR
jgi:hypothetical protein